MDCHRERLPSCGNARGRRTLPFIIYDISVSSVKSYLGIVPRKYPSTVAARGPAASKIQISKQITNDARRCPACLLVLRSWNNPNNRRPLAGRMRSRLFLNRRAYRCPSPLPYLPPASRGFIRADSVISSLGIKVPRLDTSLLR